MQVAAEGTRVAKADFLPKIFAEGDYFNFEQASPRANLGLGLGFIKLEWGLFEGGRRVGELRVADSKTRAAMALADSIADTISFETVEAYRHSITALRAIDLAKPAVTQARENYRLVKARASTTSRAGAPSGRRGENRCVNHFGSWRAGAVATGRGVHGGGPAASARSTSSSRPG